MPDDTPTAPPSGRSRGRRNVIGRSPHRDEYVRLLEAGWSSLALERYAAFRYGEEIPASTIRTFKQRKKIVVKVSPFKSIDADQVVDVIGDRAELIRLQQARIAIDVEHEQQMKKLFSTTRGEIATLNALLDAHKADLQDIGVLPRAGQKIEIDDRRGPTAEEAPRAATLGALLGAPDADPEVQSQLARVIWMATKGKRDAG